MPDPNKSADVRFRIEIVDHGTSWEAQIFDHEDHGPDMIYAAVAAASLDRVVAQAGRYVCAAAGYQRARGASPRDKDTPRAEDRIRDLRG